MNPEPCKRQFERKPLPTDTLAHVRMGGDEEPLPIEVTDISHSALFLSSNLLLPVGLEVDVDFRLPGVRGAVKATGRVIRVDEGRARPGMAVTFERMSPADRNQVRRFVD